MNNEEKPAKKKGIATPIRFDEKTKLLLKQEAYDLDRSLSYLVISICKEYLRQYKKSK